VKRPEREGRCAAIAGPSQHAADELASLAHSETYGLFDLEERHCNSPSMLKIARAIQIAL
jgi:hypothetical protein